MSETVLSRQDYDAAIFDLDGVLTHTARLHAAVWKTVFDAYLRERGSRDGEDYAPFDEEEDYRRYVDGKSRYDGVRSFLAARDITLPEGDPGDEPNRETVCGLGNRKNELFQKRLREDGVEVFPDVPPLLDALEGAGFRLAVVSASRNCRAVLEAAGLAERFQARVDGVVAQELALPGKPAPDMFLEAARRLDVEPARAVVWEDARAGVEAGRGGGFGLVVGVARTGDRQGLLDSGADRAPHDLGGVRVEPTATAAEELPSALDALDEILADAGELALFLDYDGTLTPIVDDPAEAVLAAETRATLERLAELCTVAVVSGRDLADVRRMVGLDQLLFAGSHGFDIHDPRGRGLENRIGDEFLPALSAAEDEVREALAGIDGAWVERKRYAIAVHYRKVAHDQYSRVEAAVDRVLGDHDRLRKGTGKKIFELQPDVDWDKGRAVCWLLDRLGLDRPQVRPVYVGDDVTDEDAFRALQGRGVGILVGRDAATTRATYVLADPGAVQAFLAALVARLEGSRS